MNASRSSRAMRRELRHACPHCGRDVSSFIPKQGDGSARYLRPHTCKDGKRATWIEAPGWEMRRR